MALKKAQRHAPVRTGKVRLSSQVPTSNVVVSDKVKIKKWKSYLMLPQFQ
jgi:hypothetical protein